MDTREAERHLTRYFHEMRERGASPYEAVAALPDEFHPSGLGAHLASAMEMEEPDYEFLVRPAVLSRSVVAAYGEDGVTPPEMAQLLKRMYGDRADPQDEVALGLAAAYPPMSATDVGHLLLSADIFPDLTRPQVQEALLHAGFDTGDVDVALAALFSSKTTFTVQSVPKWQDTGVTVDPGERVSIVCTGGRWTANPATGYVDANGNSRYVAKTGYTMPGEYEGALIGRAGSVTPFLVGSHATVPTGTTGRLQLCINDDLRGQYGSGFTDNRGALTVEIEESKA